MALTVSCRPYPPSDVPARGRRYLNRLRPVARTTARIDAGTRLGSRYTIEAPISTGGMGAVYSAKDEDGEHVAIKHLLDARFAQRFSIEARLLARLRHPRVVRILDHFEEDSGMYLVMELVRGTDLSRVLARRGAGLGVEEALGYMHQACEALQYVNDQQIVHRDVKPGNLIVGDDGIMLVDFGIARELVATKLTATVGVGTPNFMAPEVFAGGAVSERSDVYGVAATLWTLLAGRAPMYGERTSLSSKVPGVTPALEQAIRAGLELAPEWRISSVAAFARAIGAPLGPTGGTSLALSVGGSAASRTMLEAVVHTAAGIFDAASASIALIDSTTGELMYRAAWGAGADQIVGVRLPRGEGIAGAVASSGKGEVVPDCRGDVRFAGEVASGTGYVPITMLLVPLSNGDTVAGVLSLLDRRDGGSYQPGDLARARLFAELALTALTLDQHQTAAARGGLDQGHPNVRGDETTRPAD